MPRKLRLAGRTFSNRRSAVTFLRENPAYVQAKIGNLVQGSPRLLREAGYDVYESGQIGRLYQDGQEIARWERGGIPEPIDTGRLKDATDRGGGPPPVRVRGGRGRGRPSRAPATAESSLVDIAGTVPSVSSGIDYEALGAQMGIDPEILQGLRPNVGNLIPLSLARRGGGQTMGSGAVDDLVSRLIGDQYSRQESVLGRERGRQRSQNEHNLAQIERWYGQVIGSQGVAAERDREFGRAAVTSAEDTTRGIVSALGGEANEGSYVVGAAGQENIGNLNAISTIQDQFNADMAPLLQGEMAGQLTREQGIGGDRLRDLAMRLEELQSERGSREADLRFQVWQSNNEILDRRLQNELAIRQANAGLQQQRFQNQMGVRQFGLAAETAGMEGMTDLAGIAQEEAETQANLQNKAVDRAYRATLEEMKERGRNYRAQLGRKGRGGGLDVSKILTNEKQAEAFKDRAFHALAGAAERRGLDVDDLSEKQALQLLVGWARSLGLPVKNEAVQSLLLEALYE